MGNIYSWRMGKDWCRYGFYGCFDCGGAFLCGVFDLAGGFGSWGCFVGLGILFEVFYGRNKRRLGAEGVGKKKWQKVAGIVCLVISVINLGLAGGSFYFITHQGPETKAIRTENGVARVLPEEGFAFEGAVERDDLDEVKRVLEEKPAYWDYKAVDGSTVIGIAIANGSVEVTRFLLENGVDADVVGSSTDTAFWRCVRKIKEGIYNPEMLELLLDYGASAYREEVSYLNPIIAAMCEDGDLTDEELDLLERLVDAGMSLTNMNGIGENAEAYLERIGKENGIADDQPEQYERGLELLRG